MNKDETITHLRNQLTEERNKRVYLEEELKALVEMIKKEPPLPERGFAFGRFSDVIEHILQSGPYKDD